MGYGLIRAVGKTPELLALGIIELHKFDDHFVKLKKIFDRTVSLIDEFNPDELAIEAPFFGKNVQSMLKLGRAQGTAISAGLSRSIPIYEYAPRKIKMAITGQGNASKEQVAAILQKMLNIKEVPDDLDAATLFAESMMGLRPWKLWNADARWKGMIAEFERPWISEWGISFHLAIDGLSLLLVLCGLLLLCFLFASALLFTSFLCECRDDGSEK